jgi:acyl-CoA hydrolase
VGRPSGSVTSSHPDASAESQASVETSGQAILVKWTAVTDANNNGHVHGGTVLKLCDEAAGLAAIRHARCTVVTAAVDRMTFLHPVSVGEVLTLRASVNAAWRTSMEIGVRVEAENPLTGERHHTSSAYLTLVAVDAKGRPRPVPPLLAESATARRRSHRLAEREQIIAARGRHDGSTPKAWPPHRRH